MKGITLLFKAKEIVSCEDVDKALDLFQKHFREIYDPGTNDEALYSKALRKVVPWLVQKAPTQTISILCNHLDAVLEKRFENSFPEDLSYSWNYLPWDWETLESQAPLQQIALAIALYLACRKALSENLLSRSEVLSILQPRKWMVYRRLESSF